jgi:hypothetical protein
MNDWMKQNSYVFVDFETTGVPAEDHYPIQIGAIFTDHLFHVVDTYKSLVAWEDLQEEINKLGGVWPDRFQQAEQFHGIRAIDYVNDCDCTPGEIVLQLEHKMNNILNANIVKDPARFILVSDNIQFEWQLMRKIYQRLYKHLGKNEWPFHYCGWDTSLLLCTVGVGDPANMGHDALMDASEMHLQVVRSLDRLGFFEDDAKTARDRESLTRTFPKGN